MQKNLRKLTALALAAVMFFSLADFPVYAEETSSAEQTDTAGLLELDETAVPIEETGTAQAEGLETSDQQTEAVSEEADIVQNEAEIESVTETETEPAGENIVPSWETALEGNSLLRAGSSAQMESSVAMVEMNGDVAYYDSLNDAIKAVGTGTATITLLANASLTNWHIGGIEGNITLVGGNYTVTGDSFGVFVMGTLTIQGGNFSDTCWWYSSGTINIYGGNFSTVSSEHGTVNIYGGSINQFRGNRFNYFPDFSVEIQSVTAGSITVTPLDNQGLFGGAQYSLDGENWQTSNVLNDLKSSTSYTVYARYQKAQSIIEKSSATTNSPIYTITIPAVTLEAGETDSTSNIGVDTTQNFDLGYNGQVEVKIKNDNNTMTEQAELKLIRQDDIENHTITSALLVDGKALGNINTNIATFKTKNDSPVTVSFAKPTETNIPAGTYSGTITFEVSYSEQTA